MKLIVNADDYGLTEGVSEGIIYSHLHGIVTSTTVLANSDNLKHHALKTKNCPNLGFGIHFTLTVNKPLSNGKTIVDENGNFFRERTVDFNKMDDNEIREEFKLQFQAFVDAFGKLPTHIDSHHHIHRHEKIIPIIQEFSKQYNIVIRGHNEYEFIGSFYNDNVTVEYLLQLLQENLHKPALEIMAHPAFCDIALSNCSSYATKRLEEINVLCHPTIKQFIKDNNIELVTF